MDVPLLEGGAESSAAGAVAVAEDDGDEADDDDGPAWPLASAGNAPPLPAAEAVRTSAGVWGNSRRKAILRNVDRGEGKRVS